MAVDPEAARRAIHDRLAEPLAMSVEETAEGMIRVVNAAMTAAIRKLTVERGHDPREFALCPFGGAGPLHGAELAAELGIGRTIVPPAPGLNSAIGLLMTNLREDRIATFVRRLDRTTAAELEQVFAGLEESARERLRLSANGADELRLTRALGQRYLGQRYELPVAVEPGPLDLGRIAERFHAEHERTYGYARAEHPVEVHSAWVSAEVDLQPLRLPPAPLATRLPRTGVGAAGLFRGQLVRDAGLPPRSAGRGRCADRPGDHRAARRHHGAVAETAPGGGPLRTAPARAALAASIAPMTCLKEYSSLTLVSRIFTKSGRRERPALLVHISTSTAGSASPDSLRDVSDKR